MKKAIRWKSKAYGILYWHDSAVRWKSEPHWMEDRNFIKDNDKPQRYHVLACPLSRYMRI